ncbi:MAG: PD-(D/E)XK nuclease family protein [Rhabdochlamydiaceae bacterium]
MKPPFPPVIDNVMRSSFRLCEKRFEYSHIHNLSTPMKDIPLHFGLCLHTGLEATRTSFLIGNLSIEDAVAQGCIAAIQKWGDYSPPDKEEKRTLPHLLDCIASYFQHWPLDRPPFIDKFPDGSLILEKTVAVPIPGIFHPTSKEPLLYGGRIDGVLRHDQGRFILDDKSSIYHSSHWAQHWHLASQFTGYVWCLQCLGMKVQGVIPRGIFPRVDGVDFDETIETRQVWELERWIKQLKRDALRMIEAWKKDDWQFDFSASCFAFNRPCMFMPLCQTRVPATWFHLYTPRIWDPLHHSETED